MACPDELTLDLWLANALSFEEAALVAAHVSACGACAAAVHVIQTFESELHTGLALDTAELAFLSGQELTRTWHPSAAGGTVSWSWIALFGVVAAFAAWFVAAPLF